jgi:hypothetical protein
MNPHWGVSMKQEVKKSGVSEQSSPTVTVNQAAEDLTDEIIGGVSKISTFLGKIALLKMMVQRRRARRQQPS